MSEELFKVVRKDSPWPDGNNYGNTIVLDESRDEFGYELYGDTSAKWGDNESKRKHYIRKSVIFRDNESPSRH